jgi:5-methylthioadenosine/S-adenosylhomocysteine deaminase
MNGDCNRTPPWVSIRRFCVTAIACVCIGFFFSPLIAREKADLLITGGTVITMDAQRRLIDDGAVAIRGDSIVAVGSRAEIEARFEASKTIDARGALIMPGLINGHAHAAMSLFRGLADDLSLDDWLRKYIFPAEARNVTEDFVVWGTRLGLLEMLRGGITTYADMYYFEDAVARVTKEAGMRGVLGETIIDFPAPDNKTFAAAFAYTQGYLTHWKGDPLIVAAVAPHSIYTCSEKTLQDAAALARRNGAPILIHIAEAPLNSSKAARNTVSRRSAIWSASAFWVQMSWERIACGWIKPISPRLCTLASAASTIHRAT